MNKKDEQPGVSLIHALNKDCLEQLFARCTPRDALSLSQTCKAANNLLNQSVSVWSKLLENDYWLTIKSNRPTAQFAREVYEAKADETIRFQGVFTNGGVDENAMQYWVDNVFKVDKYPFCSNSSYNVDIIGLLLDGIVPREEEYSLRKQYMRRRCRYAAALLENINNPAGAAGQDAMQMMHIVDDWSDRRLESLFLELVEDLYDDNLHGRLLLFDIPPDRIMEERSRLVAVRTYLQQRHANTLKHMIKPPEEPDVMFDTSVVDKIQDSSKRHKVGIIHSLHLNRSGSLTCPVSTGVVFVGKIEYESLEGKSAEEIMETLKEASQDSVVSYFNNLSLKDDVELAVQRGDLPAIAKEHTEAGGICIEFNTSSKAAFHPPRLATHEQQEQEQGTFISSLQNEISEPSNIPSSGYLKSGTMPTATATVVGTRGGLEKRRPPQKPLIVWRPLVWFHFKSKEEEALEALAAAREIENHEASGAEAGGAVAEGNLRSGEVPALVPSLVPSSTVDENGAGPSNASGILPRTLFSEDDEEEERKQPTPVDNADDGLVLGGSSDDGLLSAHSYELQEEGEIDDTQEEEDDDDDDGNVGTSSASDVNEVSQQQQQQQQQQHVNMDWSDEELEMLHQGQPMVVAGMDHNEEEEETDEDDGEEEGIEFFLAGGDRTRGRNRLSIQLTRPCTANVLLVKLIDQENLMAELMDNHTYPNVDMTYLQCIGKVVSLHDHIKLVATDSS